MGPTVSLNPLENIKVSCLYLATGQTVSTFIIIILFSFFVLVFTLIFHTFHIFFVSYFSLRFFFQCSLQLTFHIPYILYVFPSVFFNSPAIHCLLFLYSFIYFSFFITFFLACFLYACTSHVSMFHTVFPPRDSLDLSQLSKSTS